MSEQETFKSILANAKAWQNICPPIAIQEIIRTFKTTDIVATSQSIKETMKLLNNSLGVQSDIFKSISNAHFTTPAFYDKTIFSSAMQGVLALESTQATLRAIGSTYSSELMKMVLNIDWQKIVFSPNPSLKIFNELLVAEANVQGSIDNEEIEIPPIPAEVEAEIGKLFNKLVSRVGKHQKILRNIFFCFIALQET